jgi:predicted transglutaminase-like cysteine proteinase
MFVRIERALARFAIIGVFGVMPCEVVAEDRSPQPSAITVESVAQEFSVVRSGGGEQEPFDNAQLTNGALVEKWTAAKLELQIDIDIIAACRAGPDACESAAAKSIIAIVEQAEKREGRARIGEINRAVNLAITATSDKIQYGVEDKWASPLTTFTSGRGDCEDYALAKYAALRAAGFRESDLRLVIVRLPRAQIDHAVLSVRHDGRWLILDNRRFAMLDAVHLDAVPLFVLRRDDARPDSVAERETAGSLAVASGGASNAPYLM